MRCHTDAQLGGHPLACAPRNTCFLANNVAQLQLYSMCRRNMTAYQRAFVVGDPNHSRTGCVRSHGCQVNRNIVRDRLLETFKLVVQMVRRLNPIRSERQVLITWQQFAWQAQHLLHNEDCGPVYRVPPALSLTHGFLPLPSPSLTFSSTSSNILLDTCLH